MHSPTPRNQILSAIGAALMSRLLVAALMTLVQSVRLPASLPRTDILLKLWLIVSLAFGWSKQNGSKTYAFTKAADHTACELNELHCTMVLGSLERLTSLSKLTGAVPSDVWE